MDKKFIRTASLIGEDSLLKLKNAKIALFGVGGVGSAVLEALVRAGVGNIDVFDPDVINETNLNRQLITTTENIGQRKVAAAAQRAKSINPDVNIGKKAIFFLPENKHQIDFSGYDYIVDAIDTVTAKIELVLIAKEKNIPIISVMGTGNKLQPEKLTVSDIYKTKVCPLCRVMRTELKKRGIKRLNVVWSDEIPKTPNHLAEIKENGRVAPASAPFVPITAGVIAASYIVNDLIK